MQADFAELTRYPVPIATQKISLRDTAFYALSIGLGQDPLDVRQLRFVDPIPTLDPVPTFALVLAHPGLWLGRPDTGIDAAQVLHGEQEIEWHARLPAEGTFIGETRVLDVLDRGVGNSLLVYSERQIRYATSNNPIVTCRQTHVIRNHGGFGGSKATPPRPHAMPNTSPALVSHMPTRQEQALLYRLNGDVNPLHSDPGFASRAGFSRPILHGMCTAGIVMHALLKNTLEYDTSRIKRMRMRFVAPIYPGETVEVHSWPDGSFRAKAAERGVLIVDNGKLET